MSAVAIAGAALKIADMVGLDDKIGRWIAGDNGAEVAQAVVDVAATATGAATPDAAVAAVQENKQHRIAVENALRDSEVELERMAYRAVADARHMRLAELKSDSWLARNTFYLLLIFGALFVVGYCVALTFLPVPPENQANASLILNVLIVGGAGAALKFLFGEFKRGTASRDSSTLPALGAFGDYGKGRS